MQLKLRKIILISLVFFLVFPIIYTDSVFAQPDSDSEASSQAVKDAEENLVHAYEKVLEAEKAGANVSELLEKLNLAAHYFELAEASNNTGQMSAAWNNATLSIEITKRVKEDAAELFEEVSKQSSQRFILTSILSFTGITIVSLTGLYLWLLIKQRYGIVKKHYLIIVTSVVLIDCLILIPFLSYFLSFPKSGQKFSEVWILDSNHQAIGKPLDCKVNETQNVFLGLRNYMGCLSYYVVKVKFTNETERLPGLFSSMPSSLKETYCFHVFISHEKAWETKVSIRISDAAFSVNKCHVNRLAINGIFFNVNSLLTWNATKRGFYYYMIFELWRYNNGGILQYHERYVWLPLNVTELV